ncbi:MAG TPA: MarR family transcriptional regulator [Candidatus Limnocylindrales bacterium]|nr:MarR family transcriptional regulator [Candidatus Limnocylindrales bacterium]
MAESLFGMFQLFRIVAQRAAQSVELGSPERARLLWGLRSGACRAGQLAQQSKISPSTITEIVEDLESEGLVRRESDPDDRRAVRVALTAEGRKHLQRFEHAAAVVLADSLSILTSTQRQRIRTAFNDLKEVVAVNEARQKETSSAR